jgi:hypothetical protein
MTLTQSVDSQKDHENFIINFRDLYHILSDHELSDHVIHDLIDHELYMSPQLYESSKIVLHKNLLGYWMSKACEY